MSLLGPLDERTILWMPDGLPNDRSLYQNKFYWGHGTSAGRLMPIRHVGVTWDWTGSGTDQFQEIKPAANSKIHEPFEKMTFCAWVWRRSGNQLLYAKANASGSHVSPWLKWGMWLDGTGKIQFRIDNTTVLSSSAISTARPAFVCHLFDGANMYIYIDGTFQGSVARTSPTQTGTGSVVFGGNPINGERYNGHMYGMIVQDFANWTLAKHGHKVLNPWEVFDSPAPFYASLPASGAIDDDQFGYINFQLGLGAFAIPADTSGGILAPDRQMFLRHPHNVTFAAPGGAVFDPGVYYRRFLLGGAS